MPGVADGALLPDGAVPSDGVVLQDGVVPEPVQAAAVALVEVLRGRGRTVASAEPVRRGNGASAFTRAA